MVRSSQVRFQSTKSTLLFPPTESLNNTKDNTGLLIFSLERTQLAYSGRRSTWPRPHTVGDTQS
jgi:hypothetical protein